MLETYIYIYKYEGILWVLVKDDFCLLIQPFLFSSFFVVVNTPAAVGFSIVTLKVYTTKSPKKARRRRGQHPHRAYRVVRGSNSWNQMAGPHNNKDACPRGEPRSVPPGGDTKSVSPVWEKPLACCTDVDRGSNRRTRCRG